MKKTVVALVLLLAACGGSDSDDALEEKWDKVWADVPDEDKDNACASLVVFGPENSGEVISRTSEGKISPEDATTMLQKSCSERFTPDV